MYKVYQLFYTRNSVKKRRHTIRPPISLIASYHLQFFTQFRHITFQLKGYKLMLDKFLQVLSLTAFHAKHGIKKRCQTWHRVDQILIYPMPCLALFFRRQVWRQKAFKNKLQIDKCLSCVLNCMQ